MVGDVDQVAARLDGLGISHPAPTHGGRVETIMISDPDANHIAFAAAHDPTPAA